MSILTGLQHGTMNYGETNIPIRDTHLFPRIEFINYHPETITRSKTTLLFNDAVLSTPSQVAPISHKDYPQSPFSALPSASSPRHSPASSHSVKATPNARRPRSWLSIAERREICQYRDSHPELTHTQIAAVFDVSRSAVSKILKQKMTWLCIKDKLTQAQRDLRY